MNTTEVYKLCALLLAARAEGKPTADLWRQLRHATGNKSARGEAYVYTRNGGRAKRRDVSPTALAVIALAEVVRPHEKFETPGATWCGSWPRTKAAWEAEREGEASFWRAVGILAELAEVPA